ncbi:MAG: hypothetical protein ABFS14_09475 [Gemmatimonadota bacterium]
MTSEGGEAQYEASGIDPWGLLRIEKLLVELEGVDSIKLVADGQGGIDEIHVLSSSDLGPKQVVRNIESALLAEFGLQIDHRKISVARVKGSDLPRIPAAQPGTAGATDAASQAAGIGTDADLSLANNRTQLTDIRIERRAGQRVTSRVTLYLGDEKYSGDASGPDFDRSRLEVTATATLEAIEKALDGEISLALHAVSHFESNSERLVVVSIRAAKGRERAYLSGVSRVVDSPEEAAVYACLNATNRWVGKP